MYANSWLYHYYSVQSKIQFGLPYEGTTRVQSTNSSYYHNHHHHHHYQQQQQQQHHNSLHQHHSPNAALQTSLSHSYMTPHHMSAYGYLSPIPQHQGSPSLISHYNSTPAQLNYANAGEPYRSTYTYQTIDSQPVDYRSQTNSQIEGVCNIAQVTNIASDMSNINSASSKSPPSKRRAVARLEPLYIPEHESSDTSMTDVHYQLNDNSGTIALSTVTPITHNRLHLKTLQTDPSDTIDQWNPSPPWSETTQKVPDIVQQELSPYLARTPPTPTSAPLQQVTSNGPAFSFDWMPEQFVPIMDPAHCHINITTSMPHHDGNILPLTLSSTIPTTPSEMSHWPHTDHKFFSLDVADKHADEDTKGKLH